MQTSSSFWTKSKKIKIEKNLEIEEIFKQEKILENEFNSNLKINLSSTPISNSFKNNLIKMIDPLIKSDSIWKSHGLYLMAEYFYSKGEKQKSKEFYQQIINLENSNPKIKIETHKRLNRDFSE